MREFLRSIAMYTAFAAIALQPGCEGYTGDVEEEDLCIVEICEAGAVPLLVPAVKENYEDCANLLEDSCNGEDVDPELQTDCLEKALKVNCDKPTRREMVEDLAPSCLHYMETLCPDYI